MKVHSKGEILRTVKIAEDELNDLALLKVSEPTSHIFALSDENPYLLKNIIVAGWTSSLFPGNMTIAPMRPFSKSYSCRPVVASDIQCLSACAGDCRRPRCIHRLLPLPARRSWSAAGAPAPFSATHCLDTDRFGSWIEWAQPVWSACDISHWHIGWRRRRLKRCKVKRLCLVIWNRLKKI